MIDMVPLRIAQIAPMARKVPPEKYGGTERVVHGLTEGLVKRGHDVTLFASGDSITSAHLVSVFPRSFNEAKIPDIYGTNELTLFEIGLAYKKQKEFDIIHDHLGSLSLPTANISQTPVVMTLHGTFTTTGRHIFESLDKPYLVSVSKDQAQSASSVKFFDTIYHGLQMENYPFSEKPEKYLLFVGRISAEKGVHFAIDAALDLNLPLIIAAKLDSYDIPYFNEYIGPRLSETGGQISWIGEVDEKKRNELMSKALCFLHPVVFREPFGLTLIEAMACGCPVVAFRKGSIPEIIIDKLTGFLVDDVVEMIPAVKKIDIIDRKECRRYALEKFNADLMVNRYEEVYRKILRK